MPLVDLSIDRVFGFFANEKYVLVVTSTPTPNRADRGQRHSIVWKDEQGEVH